MIKIIERASIETKSFNLNFDNNPDLKKSSENQNKPVPEKSDTDIQKNSEDLGKYPVIWINGVVIESNNIVRLTLNNDGFVPYLTLEFSDPTNKIIDEKFPTDNSIVSIFKESTNKALMAIKMDFKVTDFSIIKGSANKETITYYIDAIVDIDDFYLMNYESYKGTSFNVLKDLSKDMKLGFATNINTTNDNMIWINTANYKVEFLKDIVERSYIDDDTFLFGYLDFFYNFNYVDIETQLKDDISEQMNSLDRESSVKDGKDDQVPLILSNNPDYANNNMFINKYTVENSSTNINLQYGYKHYAIYYNRSDDEIKNYSLDNITTDDGNTVVMKGNENDNNILYNTMVNHTWMGKVDVDNVHTNYLHTTLQNKNNLKFLQKIKIKIRLSKVNYGLYRFQKVLVELYNMGKMSETTSADKSQEKIDGVGQHDDKIIHKLSGEWLITAINFIFSTKEGGVVQELTLVKRELTKEYTFPRRPKNKK